MTHWQVVLRTGIATAGMALLLGACAVDPTRQAALLMADEIDAYDNQMGAKVQAEQKYYKRLARDERAATSWTVALEEKASYFRAVTKLGDQALVVDKGLQLSLLQEFLRTSNMTQRTAAERRAKRIAELEAASSVSFASLTFSRKSLRQARANVMKLARETTDQDRFKILAAVVEEALEKAKKTDKLDKAENATE